MKTSYEDRSTRSATWPVACSQQTDVRPGSAVCIGCPHTCAGEAAGRDVPQAAMLLISSMLVRCRRLDELLHSQ